MEGLWNVAYMISIRPVSSVANRANDPLGSNCEGSGQLVDLRAAGVIVAFGTGIDRVAP